MNGFPLPNAEQYAKQADAALKERPPSPGVLARAQVLATLALTQAVRELAPSERTFEDGTDR